VALLAGIEYGHTASYGDLARDLGDPSLARDVGAAIGRNPLSILVPATRGGQGRQSHRLRRRPCPQRFLLDLEKSSRRLGRCTLLIEALLDHLATLDHRGAQRLGEIVGQHIVNPDKPGVTDTLGQDLHRCGVVLGPDRVAIRVYTIRRASSSIPMSRSLATTPLAKVTTRTSASTVHPTT